MTMLVELREKLKGLYAQCGVYMQMFLKFLLTLVIMFFLNKEFDFNPMLSNIFGQLILALLCSLMPLQGISLVGCLVLVGQCLSLNVEVGVLAIILLLTILLLYLRITPKDSLALVLTPLAFWMGVPAAIPLSFGLVGGVGSCLSSGCGVIVYTFIHAVQTHMKELQVKDLELLKRSKIILDSMLHEENLVVLVILFVVVTLAVYSIRKLSVDYSWQIAIGTGAVAYLAISIAASMLGGDSANLVSVVIGTAGAVLVALILQFFVFHVDYAKTEHLEFEDDEYHYFVKAVPKVIAAKEMEENAGADPEFVNPVKTGQEGFGQLENVAPIVTTPEMDAIDFASRLEESLKDL